jgi:predicted aldo/keto reductase-like oxidoreductase/radical SAM superfamily enzyme YgiQ (UPF0313 family)
MPSDLTLINLNLLFIRYGEQIERERHVPLGCLYLTRSLEAAGFTVDFRDYQLCESEDPFDLDAFLDFVAEPAPVIGLSCMANLLPFTLLAAEALKVRHPDRKIVLGGVGSKAVEDKILRRFPGIDVIARGEGEETGPELLRALGSGKADALASVQGISYRRNGSIAHNPDRPRLRDLDALPFPAFEKIALSRYQGYGMMTSRGCPYPCTFCSVAPVWNYQSFSRSPGNIVEEMALLHRQAGVDLFLFQDEFFVSGKKHVMAFCDALKRAGLAVKWKAFGRVNLIDEEMMRAMAESGCVELRFGIESGSDRVLKLIKKGFTAAESLALIPKAVQIFPSVDAFYVWGFPFETLDDFNQTLFQMVSFRTMGARILPSLLCLLPQTPIYEDLAPDNRLEFCPWLLPEFVITGHEVLRGNNVEVPARHRRYFDLITANPDVFPGFFHFDLEGNVMPKLELLRRFGFYLQPGLAAESNRESCGAPRLEQAASRGGPDEDKSAMLYRKAGKTEKLVSILGFGCMRLPVREGKLHLIDEERALAMVDSAIGQGVNYFDTAYVYHSAAPFEAGMSEVFLGRALKGRRHKVNVATKLPSWLIGSRADMDRYLDQQLERLQTDHIDFYFLHSLTGSLWSRLSQLGAAQFLDAAVADGRIQHAGFSFHDASPEFKQIVDAYDWSLCQIQYNFMDEDFQAGRVGLEYAAGKGLGVVIMEPLRGGGLTARIPAEVQAVWDKAPVRRTPAEWALRFVWNRPEASVVLSGMSELRQLEENINYASGGLANSLAAGELELIREARAVYQSRIRVHCTNCGYCLPCPASVQIPANFQQLNNLAVYQDRSFAEFIYHHGLTTEQRASHCEECGQCEDACPQHIPIRMVLKEVAREFEHG